MQNTHIKRFGIVERVFHFFLILTFLIQTITGFSRLFFPTTWGKSMNALLGGYDSATLIHKWVGVLMICGFIVHTIHLITKIDRKNIRYSLFGPDSLIPNLDDFKNLIKMIFWFAGRGQKPTFGRWSYWEKFDYWAVYWGIPLLGITGVMLMYPVIASQFVPGWTLNIAVLLHKAEAILAVLYVFIVHFYVGHLRPSNFPMNEAMFAGSISMEELEEEKTQWLEQLKKEGKLQEVIATPPSKSYKSVYLAFGYAAVILGLYLLVIGIINSGSITLH